MATMADTGPAPPQQPPGYGHLTSRLRRAASVASPEAEAFLCSVALLRQVQDLLPLTRAGRPPAASPPLRQVARAFAVAAAAGYTAPQPPPLASQARAHLRAYLPVAAMAGSPSSSPSSPGSLQPPDTLPRLASLLAAYTAAVERVEAASVGRPFDAGEALDACSRLGAIAERLADGGWAAATDAQLAVLASPHAPEPPLTARQLQLAACTTLAGAAAALLNDDQKLQRLGGVPPAQVLQLRALAAAAGAALLRLDPGSPRACLLAAYAALGADASYRGDPRAQRRALALYRRSHELANAQGSDYWAVRTAAGWLMLVAVAGPAALHGAAARELQAAVTAFERAEAAALPRCRRHLPSLWVATLAGSLSIARKLLPAARSRLAAATSAGKSQQQQQARPATGAQRRALRSSLAAAAGAAVQAAAAADTALQQRCDGCSATAAGLRSCAGCRSARYCRWAMAAWEASRHVVRCHMCLCRLTHLAPPPPSASPCACACSRACQLACWADHRLECRQIPGATEPDDG